MAAERARLAAEEKANSEEARKRAQAEADYQVWLEMKARVAREEAEQKFERAQERARRNRERKQREREKVVDRAGKEAMPDAGTGSDAIPDSAVSQ
jgi:phage repressor protein C with HTH and peptisase S24 domain